MVALERTAKIALETLTSTDSSKWLQEQKAQWRREVLEEAAEQFADHDNANYYGSHIKAVLRRMAEQPESK